MFCKPAWVSNYTGQSFKTNIYKQLLNDHQIHRHRTKWRGTTKYTMAFCSFYFHAPIQKVFCIYSSCSHMSLLNVATITHLKQKHASLGSYTIWYTSVPHPWDSGCHVTDKWHFSWVIFPNLLRWRQNALGTRLAQLTSIGMLGMQKTRYICCEVNNRTLRLVRNYYRFEMKAFIKIKMLRRYSFHSIILTV